jgi:glycosyltransferase involved in cell wall biosynthesis
MGNHFAHKASDATAEDTQGSGFPDHPIRRPGNAQRGCPATCVAYRSGTLGDKQMESLYTRASVVVLPSHVEGFGLGLVHALAARKGGRRP